MGHAGFFITGDQAAGALWLRTQISTVVSAVYPAAGRQSMDDWSGLPRQTEPDLRRTGRVRQLLALDALDNLLAAQRDRAARWRATETNRQPTPATLSAMAAFDAVQPAVAQATSALGSALQKEGAEGETLTRYQALQMPSTVWTRKA
jgi:hypothetical protein